MIPKSGDRFSDKIMLKVSDLARDKLADFGERFESAMRSAG